MPHVPCVACNKPLSGTPDKDGYVTCIACGKAQVVRKKDHWMLQPLLGLFGATGTGGGGGGR